MIRYGLFFIIVCALFFAPISAYADLIFEPDNDFFNQHRAQIMYLGRSFSTNGEDGGVSVKRAPGARRDISRLQNGETIYIDYSCLYDGELWGLSGRLSGWVKMDQLLVLYDYVAFQEEHLDEFYEYDGDFNVIGQTSSAIAWPWPGAGELLWTFEDLDMESFWVSHAYMDSQGREWGFVGYLYGSRNIWICLSEPLNRDIPAFNPAPEPQPWVSDTVHTEIMPPNSSSVIIIIAMVAALVAATAILIKVLWKPKGNID